MGRCGDVVALGKSYNHRLRANLSKIATNIYLNRRFKVGSKLLEDIEGLPLKKAIYTLQLKMLKILKSMAAEAVPAGRRAVKARRLVVGNHNIFRHESAAVPSGLCQPSRLR